MHHDISYPEALELLERYPYFIYAAIIALPLAPDDETRQRLQAIISLNTPGKQNASAPAATSHKKECQSTVDAIDAFLAGHDPSGITQAPYIPGDGLPEPAPASGHTPPADTSLLTMHTWHAPKLQPGEKMDVDIAGIGWFTVSGDVRDIYVKVHKGVDVTFRKAMI